MANVTKRALKIGARSRQNVMRKFKTVPEIKLAGKWLEAAGFTPGEMVEIMIESGLISLKVK